MKKRVILGFAVSLLFLAFCWSYYFPSVGLSIPQESLCPHSIIVDAKSVVGCSQALWNFHPMGNIIAPDYRRINYTPTLPKTCSGSQHLFNADSSNIYIFFSNFPTWKVAVVAKWLHNEPTWTGTNLYPLEWVWTLWSRAIKLPCSTDPPAPPSPRLHCAAEWQRKWSPGASSAICKNPTLTRLQQERRLALFLCSV